jgi:putative heme-binding domain-containing protein
VIEEGIEGTEMPGAWQLSKREVASVGMYVRSTGAVAHEDIPGDPAAGEGVYKGASCQGCHIIAGSGSGFGPELTEIGARRSAAYLREALVKPGAAVPEDFLLVEVVSADGTKLRGVRANEDSFTIQIKDSTGAFHSFRKSQLKELRRLSGESPMPSYETMTGANLDDLVAYLSSLRGKP